MSAPQNIEGSSAAVLEALQACKLNDCTIFSEDLAITAVGQAHAMTVALAEAVNPGSEPGSDYSALRPFHIARALDGIGTLLALSALATHARSARP